MYQIPVENWLETYRTHYKVSEHWRMWILLNLCKLKQLSSFKYLPFHNNIESTTAVQFSDL